MKIYDKQNEFHFIVIQLTNYDSKTETIITYWFIGEMWSAYMKINNNCEINSIVFYCYLIKYFCIIIKIKFI